MRLTIRIIQGFLAGYFLIFGIVLLFTSAEDIKTLYTNPLGFTVGFIYVIKAVEAIAAVGLIIGYWIPKYSLTSSAILALIMAGAVFSHLFADQEITVAIIPFILMVLSFVVYFGRRSMPTTAS